MNFANKISIFRILNIPFFIASLYYSKEKIFLRPVALGIFIVAVISDLVDGYIARRTPKKSPAGLILDPLADKLLLVSAFICLYMLGEFPFWVVLIVISRDILITCGALIIYILKQNLNITSTWWGKLATFFQVTTVITVLVRLEFAPLFWWLAIVFTIISGLDYTCRGFKVLYANDNSRNSH